MWILLLLIGKRCYMAKSKTQENILARLFEDWLALLDLRLKYELGTPQRQELDLRFVKVRPLIMIIKEPRYTPDEISILADIALRVLEPEEKPES